MPPAIRRLATATCAALLLQTATGHAEDREIETLRSLIETPEGAADLMSERFAEAVPTGQLTAILQSLHDKAGPVTGITEDGDGYLIRAEAGDIPAEIELDASGKITGLFFHPFQPSGGSIEDTLADIAALPGTVSYLVTAEGETLHEQNAETPLAVGSTFKLGVLKVLMDDIAAGDRRWADVETLQPEDLSLPSGKLQTFPPGSPFTLHTLAALMISESDNTATDMLMRILGPERVATALGLDHVLTTRALFTLKADPALAERYRTASGAERAELLAEISDAPLPAVRDASGPAIEGVEWYLSAQTLCRLAGDVKAADVFAINKGPVRGWQSVAYKGGSEPGVLNLTAALTGEDGRGYCISVTVNNDDAIDEATVAGAFAALASQLRASR
ncbi:serine hydrolase [Martelella sp. FOR1707]